MVVFPNCKINLGLHVIRKRNDGYHDLQTVFYPIAIYDAVEVIQNTGLNDPVQLSTSGIVIEGKAGENLCVRAYQLLKNDFPNLPAIKLHLHKTIPPGAGLGGGSADGTFTLTLLNRKFELGLSIEKLLDYALQLGSDCPFFVINKPCFATGRGEVMEQLQLDLSPYKMVIVNPGIHIKTAEVFSLINSVSNSKSIKETIQQKIETWKEELTNDFEGPIFLKYPEIRSIKEKLYEAGAIYSSMTGSGSTVYGIFKKESEPSLSFPSRYFVKELISKA